MKVYLVSEVIAYSDEPMVKRFEAFTTEKDAIKYKNWLKENWIAEYMDYYECEEDELEDWIEITYDMDCLWGTLSPDGIEELEIEVIELDLSSIK